MQLEVDPTEKLGRCLVPPVIGMRLAKGSSSSRYEGGGELRDGVGLATLEFEDGAVNDVVVVVVVDAEESIDCRATEIEVEARRAPSKEDASLVASIWPDASVVVAPPEECEKMACHDIRFNITFSSV